MGGEDLAVYGGQYDNTTISHINGKPIIDMWSVKQILDTLPEDCQFLCLRTDDSDVDNIIVRRADAQKESKYHDLYKVHSPQMLVSHYDLWRKATNAVKLQAAVKEKTPLVAQGETSAPRPAAI